MKIHNRATQAEAPNPTAAGSPLPKGFDDQWSPFYVPPALREEYAAADSAIALETLIDDADQMLQQAARRAVWAHYDEARSRNRKPSESGITIRERSAPDVASFPREVMEKREEMTSQLGIEHFIELARHARRLDAASAAADRARQEARDKEAWIRRASCPVCGETSRSTAARTLLHGTAPVRSCERCAREITRLADESRRAHLSTTAIRNIQLTAAELVAE